MSRATSTRLLLTLAAAASLLAGCGTPDDGELRQWVTNQRNQSRPKVEPIPPPKQFSPQGTEENDPVAACWMENS